MRKGLLLAVMCCMGLIGLMALPASGQYQPLNVKTGLWQVTATTALNGIPPEMQAQMQNMTPEQRARAEAMMKNSVGGPAHTTNYSHCVTEQDLKNDPFSRVSDKCNWTVLSSTGTEMEVKGTCTGSAADQLKVDVDMKLQVVDSENVKGTGQGHITGSGGDVHTTTTFVSKWVSASCPAGSN